ncbi:MAG: large conductance mechanosensitive channel protein MscL [Solirubrobacterales bacterium]|nr:large conductance mechanosensitive channel protein MscL [Solirubrobacterales bacterium]
MLKEFRDFILRGNVVELAVAVIIGAAFGAIVTALASSFITPLIALIGGKPDFGGLAFTISGTEFPYGRFLNALIAFLIIAAVVFFLVVRPMNTLMARIRSDDEPASDAPAEDVVLLTEIRDLLRGQATAG